MFLAVTGSRLLKNQTFVNRVMNAVHDRRRGYGGPITKLAHGGARGTDLLVDNWARKHGFVWGETLIELEAEWDKFDLKAGRIRNQAIADLKPDVLLVFDGGAGTLDMCRRARRAGVRRIFAEDIMLPREIDSKAGYDDERNTF